MREVVEHVAEGEGGRRRVGLHVLHEERLAWQAFRNPADGFPLSPVVTSCSKMGGGKIIVLDNGFFFAM